MDNVLELPQLVQSKVTMTDTVLGTLEAHAKSKGATHWGFSEANKNNAETALLIYGTNQAKTTRFAKYLVSKELSKEYYAGTVKFEQLLGLEVRLAKNEAGEEIYIVSKPSALIAFSMDLVKATEYKPQSTLSDADALKWANASV